MVSRLLSRQFRLTSPLLTRSIRTQPIQDNFPSEGNESPQSYPPGFGLATPRELVEYLNQFIVGQESAKKVLSVAVFNHYNRVRANMAYLEAQEVEYNGNLEQDAASQRIPLMPRRQLPLFEKSNVLVIGPTGSGKTLLARTLAKVLDVPFSVSDATSFTQAGYVGEDVDMAVQRLLQAANWDPLRASMGIVYIDEVDKIARKTAGSGMESSRDVGGEGVQQALLRMMEGSVVTVQSKGAAAESPILPGSDGGARGGQRAPNLATPKSDVYQIDTTNVLFILSGAFVGLDNVIKQRVAKGSIGFTANLNPDNEHGLPFFTPNRKASHNVIDLVETTDLVKYGFIPEFISRLPSITTLSPLTVRDLRRILTEVKGSLMSQYQSLFGYSGVEIRFTTAALDEICHRASERGGGARGLRGIMEGLLLEPMYEVPGSDIRHVLITGDVVRGDAAPGYWRRGEGVAFWEAWAAEEGKTDKKQIV
ncbi:P-loop containing nucleoside triphosphate hydrolase protein [Infundibulicybe gibba]|nr:P-loop containing nucleoside triphosphate hydrolase protein [Infundibulicybe gibba]